MADVMDDFWRRTGYQPVAQSYPVDYASRYHAGLGYGRGVFESIQRADAAAQIQYAQAENSMREDTIRAQIYGGQDSLAAYLGGPGMRSDVHGLQSAIMTDDIEGARQIRDRMRKMASDNRESLVAWQDFADSGKFGRMMADNARILLDETYLDSVVPGGSGGLTVRAVLDNATPEARARAASRASRKYRVSGPAGDIIANPDNPLYFALDGIRDLQSAGVTARRQTPAVAAGMAAQEQAESALPLYAEFGASYGSDWDVKAKGDFIAAAASTFKGSLGAGQLRTLADLYRADARRAGGTLDVAAWMRERQGAAQRMTPTEVQPVPTNRVGKDGMPELVLQRVPVAGTNVGALQDHVLHAREIADRMSQDIPTDELERRVAGQVQRQHDLERRLGAPLANFGFRPDMLSYAAVASAMGNGYIAPSEAPTAHTELGRIETAALKAESAFGYREGLTGVPEPGDHGSCNGLTRKLVTAIVKADLDTPQGQSSDAGIRSALVRVLKDERASNGSGLQDADIARVADRVVKNWREGRSESVSTILMDEGGYLQHDAEGNVKLDTRGQPQRQSPVPKVSLVTGAPTKTPPTLDEGQMGYISTSPENMAKAKADPGYNPVGRALWKASRDTDDPQRAALAREVLRVQQHGLTGRSISLREQDSARKALGGVIVKNFQSGVAEVAQGKEGFGPVLTDFFDTGDAVKFLQEADKGTRVTGGDDSLVTRAWEAMEELAGDLLGVDEPGEVDTAKAALFTHLFAEAVNRGSRDAESAPNVYQLVSQMGIEHLVTRNAPALAPLGTHPWSVRPLSGPLVFSGRLDGDAEGLLSNLQDQFKRRFGSSVRGAPAGLDAAFKHLTGFVFPTGIGHRDQDSKDTTDYGLPLAWYEHYTFAQPEKVDPNGAGKPAVTPAQPEKGAPGGDGKPDATPVVEESGARDRTARFREFLRNYMTGNDKVDFAKERIEQAKMFLHPDANLVDQQVKKVYADIDDLYQRTGDADTVLDYTWGFLNHRSWYQEDARGQVTLVGGTLDEYKRDIDASGLSYADYQAQQLRRSDRFALARDAMKQRVMSQAGAFGAVQGKEAGDVGL